MEWLGWKRHAAEYPPFFSGALPMDSIGLRGPARRGLVLMKRAVYRVMAVALAGSASLIGGGGAMAQPVLSHVTPGAVVPGKTTELTLHGSKLDGPLHVWTSFPAQIEFAAADEKVKDRKDAVCKLT